MTVTRRMPYLERQRGLLVGDALLHRQPMQFLQQGCATILAALFCTPLQLVDGAGWSAVGHSVAVVNPTTCKRLCEVHDGQYR